MNMNVPEHLQDENPQPLRLGTVLDEKYEVLEFVGSGGMGSVYRTRHLELGKDVAIKVLHPRFAADASAVKRFQREARIISGLRHSNILSVFAFGNVSGLVYMAMEYIQGRSLRELVRDAGPLRPEKAIPLLVQICNAMTHAHANDVLHRDLKPDNAIVLTNADGSQLVKVVDFGLAKLLDGTEGQRLTRTGEVLGDPNYMSPEQCQGKELDARSDIYSMGCLMYEIFEGAPPFLSDTAVASMYKQLADRPAPFAQKRKLPAAIETIVFCCMEKDSQARYESFADLKQALEQFAAKPGLKLRSRSSKWRLNYPKVPSRLAVAAVICCCLLLGIAYITGSLNAHLSSDLDSLRVKLAAELHTIEPGGLAPFRYPDPESVADVLVLSELLKDDNARATGLFVLARMCGIDGRIAKGIKAAEEGLRIPNLDKRRRALLLEQLGKLHYFDGNYKKCEAIFTELSDDVSLFSNLDGQRASFAYALGTTKMRLGKLAEAEKTAKALKYAWRPSTGAINLESMFVGELLCKQKKFAEAERLENVILQGQLHPLLQGTVLESFSNWFAANGDLGRARATNARLLSIAKHLKMLYLEQCAAVADVQTDALQFGPEKVLKKSGDLVARLSKHPVSPGPLLSASRVYVNALEATGHQAEAKLVTRRTAETVARATNKREN